MHFYGATFQLKCNTSSFYSSYSMTWWDDWRLRAKICNLLQMLIFIRPKKSIEMLMLVMWINGSFM